MHKVLMYSRPRCHLCDEARIEILRVRETVPFDLDEISIEGDEDLEREYGIRIPVVLVDGEELFEYRVDADEFRSALA